MITLNRSTRDVGEFLQCGVTSEKVGPGSYSAASHGDASSNVKGSLAPFYSLQQKVLNRNTATSALTPGMLNFLTLLRDSYVTALIFADRPGYICSARNSGLRERSKKSIYIKAASIRAFCPGVNGVHVCF
eukprot:GHVQ01027059.1.p1 GENE.GHVQ01027059.1~~GHVQ01027059.1.p1  ORF type:complete len:131 (+),score=2.59 GHVQ01027059.1:486-878(+)